MKHSLKFIILSALLFLAACSPEAVEVTREVVVEQEVEVTRLVEVTKEVSVVEEVEVTRIVEVEIEVEVTRIVEVEVTAVPTETPTPEPTNTPVPQTANNNPQPTATASVNLQDELLASMLKTRSNINAFGGLLDGASRSGSIDCQEVVNIYDAVVNAPTYDTSNADDLVRNAYPSYRSAIDVFHDGARDMSENCRNFLSGTDTGSGIGMHQWQLARLEVGTALNIIQPAILSLGGE